MSAPYVAACLLAGLMVLVFCILRRMGTLRNLKVTAQIAKIFSLSIEATSDGPPPAAGDGSPHDPRLSPRGSTTRLVTPPGLRAG